MRRLFSVVFVLIFFPGVFFAQTVFTSAESDMIYKTLDARLRTRLFSSEDEAISFLSDFEKALDFSSVGDECELVVLNMISLEKYNYMYQKNPNDSALKPFILEQYQKIEDWEDSHKNQTMSAWFYLSAGDIINSSMQFIPQGTAIKLGLKEKKEYDDILSSNPSLSFALINAALWYYFAPSIGGGSKSKAKEYFERAVQSSSCDYERFYSRIYLSQIYFEESDREASERLLSQADGVLLNNVYTPFVRFLNDNEVSLFYYTNNREKTEKKLGL